MDSVTTFDSIKEGILDLLRSIQDGRTQLPDFQREWVWDDDHLKSLLVSISLSYPIGAMMMLQTGNPGVKLQPRLVTGASGTPGLSPERLILDGQQRLTSLFLALRTIEPVPTSDSRHKSIKRWYYIDMARSVDPESDRDEAVLGIPEDRIVRNFRGEPLQDYSSPDNEYANLVFPLNQAFDVAKWRRGFNEHWKNHPEKTALYDRFEAEIIERFKQYHVPVIVLRKETPKEAVCQVFEKVNTGGVALNVFELLTATFAADNFSLRDDWKERVKVFKERALLNQVESTDFLQAITLLATWERRTTAIKSGIEPEKAPGIGCKRPAILKLTLDEYKAWSDRVAQAFIDSARLLHSQNIFTARDLPYPTQLVPLSAALTALAQELSAVQREKLLRWFWCGVFGELYGSAVESRFARDLPDLLAWLSDGPEPGTVNECNFLRSRLLSLRSRNSAAYKGLHALMMRSGASDFRTGEPISDAIYAEEKIDIHHIFPQAWCKTNGIESGRCDSIVNKTPISARTNRTVGGNAPSIYLGRLEARFSISTEKMNALLRSHLIDSTLLRADDFAAFFAAREQTVLDLIAKVTGKVVNRDIGEPEAPPTDYEEEEAA
jgi:hypothetical protein